MDVDYIIYDGIDCRDLGLEVVSVGTSGMTELPFGIKKNITYNKETINQIVPYKENVEYENLEFNITLALIDEDQRWDMEYRKKIAKWLFQKEDKELILGDIPDIVYDCSVVGNSSLFINYIFEGYITFKFKCNAPHGRSKIYTQHYDYQSSTDKIIEIENKGNVEKYYYPEVIIEMANSTDVQIINLSNGGRIFEFNNLNIGETIYVNNELSEIESDAKVIRFENFNKKWLQLVQGINRLKIVGDVNITFRMSYPITL